MFTLKFARRLIPLVGMFALAGSLVLNVFLYQQGRAYYLELNETRLDPLGMRYYSDNSDKDISDQAAILSSNQRVLFYGDSRAAQWEKPNGFDNLEFINRGIGAQTTAQVLGRFVAHVMPLQPKVIVLQVGINDLKTIPLFPHRKEEIITNCKANIQHIVEQSRQSGAEVILTTIFPLGQLPVERRPFWSDEVALAITDVNQFLLSLQEEHVKLLDTTKILAHTDAKVDIRYSKDFLHLNKIGYEALNQELGQVLQELE